MDEREQAGIARVNFNLPRKTFERMMELARIVGIESVGGAGKYFCMMGIQGSMSSLLAAKNADLVAQNVKANLEVSAFLQACPEFAEMVAKAGGSTKLDTMGITPDRKEGEKGSLEQRGKRMK